MEFQSALAERRYADLVEVAAEAVIGLDFDGVLSPIVPEPDQAVIHPDGPDVLVALADQVKAVAVVTGRPARQAVSLGALDGVGSRIAERGHDLLVLGQYGNERWSAKDRTVRSPRPPKGLATFMTGLTDLLVAEGLQDAHLEEKGLAVAIHTRRMTDPVGALKVLEPLLRERAARHGLALEPGRMVIEVRAPGMNKGEAVRRLQHELSAAAVMFVGDDLGDVEAFRAVMGLREQGLHGLLVCSGSDEQPALVELADLVVDGPDGVMALLKEFTAAAAGRAHLG